MGRWSARTAVVLGSPLHMAVSSLIHPHPPFRQPGMLDFLRPRLSLWMGVHVVQLFLVLLLGLALWFLTEGLASRAASSIRLATALFLVFYAAFDSIAGIGTGLLARVVPCWWLPGSSSPSITRRQQGRSACWLSSRQASCSTAKAC